MKPETNTASTRRSFPERDFPLSLSETPAPGSHIVSIRRGYSHHGIYIGNGKVVHYAGLSRRWVRGPVEEVSFEQFAAGRAVFVRPHCAPRFDRAEVAARARSRIGEASYRLFTNNCEHLCEWCVRGEPRSTQIEALQHAPRRLLLTVYAAVALGLRQCVQRVPTRGGWAT